MAGGDLNTRIIISAIDSTRDAFEAIKDNAGKLAAALTAIFSVDFFKGSVDSAAQFELQLDTVAVKTGVTGQALDELKNAAISIGNEFGKTGTEALKGMEIIASAGYSAADSIKLLPAAFVLADNSGQDLADSSVNLVNILKTLGLETGQASRVTDVLSVAAGAANTTVAKMTESLLGAGGIAKASGKSLEETAAIIDLFANAGLQGAEASTAMRNIMLELQDPAKASSKAIKALGIDSTDIVEVFKQLKTKGDAGSEAIKQFDAANIAAAFGLRENIGSYDGLLKSFQGIDGAAKAASDKLGDNFISAFEDLGAMFTNLRNVLGQPILAPLKTETENLKNKIQELTESGVIEKIGKSLASAFSAATVVVKEYLGTIDFTTIGEKVSSFAIATALTFQTLTDDAKAVANVFSLIYNSVATVFDGFKTTAAVFEASVVAVLGGINKKIGDVALGWGEIFKLMPGFESVGKSLSVFGDNMKKSGDAAILFATSLKEQAEKEATKTAEAATKAATAFSELTDSTKKTVPEIVKVWESAFKASEALDNTKESTDNAAKAQAELAKNTSNTTQTLADSGKGVNDLSTLYTKQVDELGRVTLGNIGLKNAAHETHQTIADSGKGVNDLSELYTKQVDELGRVTLGNIGLKKATDETKSSTDNLKNSIGAIPDSKETKITADTAKANQKIDELKQPTDSTHTVDANAEKPKEEIETLRSKESDTISVHTFGSNDTAVNEDIERITQDTSSTHTIYVQTIQQNANGGQIQYFATGGQPKFIRREGGLGGYGGGDTVPAMLEAGEWIIKKESVQKYGNGFMAQINEGKLDIPRFSTGGRVDDIKERQNSYKEQIDELTKEMKGMQSAGDLGSLSWAFYNPFEAKAIKDSYNDKQRQVKKLQQLLDGTEDEMKTAQRFDKLDAEREKEQKAIDDENKRIADEQRRRDDEIYKQKEQTLKLKGDDVGLENLRYEREKQDLAGNEPALQQAAINNQLALAKIEEEKQKKAQQEAEKAAKEKADADKKAADEAKKITDEEEKSRKKAEDDARKLAEQQAKDAEKLKIEGFKLSGDNVGLENFNYEKEKQSLAGNKDALKQAEINHNLRLEQLKQKEKPVESTESKSTTTKQTAAQEKPQELTGEAKSRADSIADGKRRAEKFQEYKQQEAEKKAKAKADRDAYIKERLDQERYEREYKDKIELERKRLEIESEKARIPQSSGQTITIQFVAPSGRSATGSFAQNDASAIVDILKEAAASGSTFEY